MAMRKLPRRWLRVNRVEPAIELVGERLAVLGVEVRGSSGDEAIASEIVQKVANRQPFTHVRVGVKLAAGIEGLATSGNHVGGERNVGSDDQIAWSDQFHNLPVRDIQSGRDQQARNVLGSRSSHRLIGDEGDLCSSSLSGSKQHFLDLAGTGIGIHPDLHGENSSGNKSSMIIIDVPNGTDQAEGTKGDQS